MGINVGKVIVMKMGGEMRKGKEGMERGQQKSVVHGCCEKSGLSCLDGSYHLD